MSTWEQTSIQLKNGKELIIRTPREGDALKLIEFIRQVSIDSQYLLMSADEKMMTEEQEIQWIKANNENPGAIVLLGEIDSEIISITNAGNGRRKRNAHVAHLGTSVAKKYRGQGIGSAMMKELCQWGSQHKVIEYLELSVMTDNENAQGLYKSLGFEVVGRIPNAFKYEDGTYQENIIMRLKLVD